MKRAPFEPGTTLEIRQVHEAEDFRRPPIPPARSAPRRSASAKRSRRARTRSRPGGGRRRCRGSRGPSRGPRGSA
jgi:hypothetical protein